MTPEQRLNDLIEDVECGSYFERYPVRQDVESDVTLLITEVQRLRRLNVSLAEAADRWAEKYRQSNLLVCQLLAPRPGQDINSCGRN